MASEVRAAIPIRIMRYLYSKRGQPILTGRGKGSAVSSVAIVIVSMHVSHKKKGRYFLRARPHIAGERGHRIWHMVAENSALLVAV